MQDITSRKSLIASILAVGRGKAGEGGRGRGGLRDNVQHLGLALRHATSRNSRCHTIMSINCRPGHEADYQVIPSTAGDPNQEMEAQKGEGNWVMGHNCIIYRVSSRANNIRQLYRSKKRGSHPRPPLCLLYYVALGFMVSSIDNEP
jgi:hypothetical protein